MCKAQASYCACATTVGCKGHVDHLLLAAEDIMVARDLKNGIGNLRWPRLRC